MKRLLAGIVIVFLLGVAVFPASPDKQTLAQSQGAYSVPKVFHIAGVPSLSRGARVDLHLTQNELILQQGEKKRLIIPYERVRRVVQLSGERNYPKATYAAAVSTFGVGALLILKKRIMDTLVVDFSNERGGLMGAVLQLPQGQGQPCKQWLLQHDVRVEEPELAPAQK